MINEYSLYETVTAANKHVTLEDTIVIACQHLLVPNCTMLTELCYRGLKPSNLHVIGKSYSFNEIVASGLELAGANVYRYAFNSHQSFDEQFALETNNFVKAALCKASGKKRLLVIDDGGLLLDAVLRLEPTLPTFGVEQTSSGYNRLKEKKVPFPIVNVARSDAKLTYESPLIASYAMSCLNDLLSHPSQSLPHNALVIGRGHIGTHIVQQLEKTMDVVTYDATDDASLLPGYLNNAHLILGCTGATSIPHSLHKYLDGAMLCSISSSDREFDAVHLRRQAVKNSQPHGHYILDNCMLMNAGFPITFRGYAIEQNALAMSLTHSLVLAGAYQALDETAIGFVDLQKSTQEKLVVEWNKLRDAK